MSNDKIIELGKRMPVEEMIEKNLRVAGKELEQAANYTKEAEKNLKAFYKCLEDDNELAHYEAQFGVTGKMNVIYASFPDRDRAMLDDMLKDA